MFDRHEIVHVATVERVAKSAKSMKIKRPGDDDADGVWVPLSLIEETDLGENGDHGFMRIPFWIAEDRGIEGWIIDPDDPNENPTPPADDYGDAVESLSDSDDDVMPF